MSRQCSVILARLQNRLVSNEELSGIALKYTSRISDLRKREYDIRVVRRDYGTGLVWYGLFVNGKRVA